ncbi:MAG: TonB-dependent receptor plug domain-containing protein, partial [Pseudomonadota bacterium]|nr:TonB-dependent receptor plug domain-containing protein [Pseudomonadota bacterium]
MRIVSTLLFAGSASALALTTAVSAQNVATAATPVATPEGVEEIIVTAQRQSQSLQDVPIAVSAFTGATLARQNITNTTLLQQQLPNITFTKTNYTSSNFAIRGVGNTAVGTSIDSGVGVAFNEMPLFSPLLFETEYFDLDRIEVLRGPQGTLFGRNATSGVINVITKKPDSHLGAGAELEYGNYNSRKVTGDINIPLSSLGIGQDLGGFRVAGLYLKRGGFTTNLFDNSKIDGRDLYSVRASLRLTPGPDTTIDLVGSYFHEKDNRSRSQKQLCHRDPTGILGCLPDSLQAEPINSNAFFANVITSKEFLALNGFGAAAGPLSLNSVYGKDTYSGALVPADLRTVNAQYNPTYSASEKIFEVHIEHRFGKATLNVIGGYSESANNGRVDYNLVIPNAISPAIPGTAQAFFGKSSPV